MSADLIAPLFVALATVVMVLLWRRGPARRRAFYIVGLVAASGSFLFAVAYDEIDRRAAELPDLELPRFELALPEVELPSLLEIDQPGTAWDDLEMDRMTAQPGPAMRTAALPDRIGLAADGMLPHALELAIAELPGVDRCEERSDRAMRPATLVLSCWLADDVELRLARFVLRDQAAAWLSHRASGVRTYATHEQGDTVCRSARPAKSVWAGGSYVCWARSDAQQRLAWTDEDRQLAGMLISTSVPFDELYRLWRDDPGLAATVRREASASLPAPGPVTMPTVDPTTAELQWPALPAVMTERIGRAASAVLPHALELALSQLPELTDCRERDTAIMRPAFFVVSCMLADGTELRVGRFGSPGPDRWIWTKGTAIRFAPVTIDAHAYCRDGRPASGSYDAGDFLCWDVGRESRVAWSDESRGLAGMLSSRTVGIDELYRTWREGTD